MNKISITGIHTNLLDVSTMEVRDYIQGDTEIVLTEWNINPAVNYFEKSEASINLSKLPQPLQERYHQFEDSVIAFMRQLP